MRILKHGLERHPGVDSTTLSVTVPCSITAEEAWRRVVNLEGVKPGDRYSLQSGSCAALEGVVSACDPPENFVGIAENLNDGLVGIYCGFQGKTGLRFVNATFVLWGPARARAKEIEAAWTEGLRAATADVHKTGG